MLLSSDSLFSVPADPLEFGGSWVVLSSQDMIGMILIICWQGFNCELQGVSDSLCRLGLASDCYQGLWIFLVSALLRQTAGTWQPKWE